MERNDREPVARRVRHELKMRLLEVRRVSRPTPTLVRVTLAGNDLEGFVSASYDDHVKVFFPEPGQDKPVLPRVGPNGPEMPEGRPRPAARDYTPRRYDAEARELELEFVLHGEGPATSWAAQAAPGQFLGVGGPRGSFVVDAAFDGYVLVGDESALPAIGRRLEELPQDAHVLVIAEVGSAADEISFPEGPGRRVQWVHRGDTQPGDAAALLTALTAASFPPGDVYTWVAAESSVAKALRRHLVDERQLPKAWVKAAGYWKRGASASHETHDD